MRDTAQQQTYTRLKEALHNKQLLPGMQLVEAQLSELFQMSRTPIRNALTRLESEGYVEQIKNRGTFVINPTADEVIQAFEVRTTLELALIKDTESEQLKTLAENMRRLLVDEHQAVMNQAVQAYLEANRRFHLNLVSRAKNGLMRKLYLQVFDQIIIYLTLYDDFYEMDSEAEVSMREHHAIIEAMSRGNLKELERLLYQHEASTIRSLHLEKIRSRTLKHAFENKEYTTL